MTTLRLIRTSMSAGLVACLALAGAACGDDDDPTSPSSATTPGSMMTDESMSTTDSMATQDPMMTEDSMMNVTSEPSG